MYNHEYRNRSTPLFLGLAVTPTTQRGLFDDADGAPGPKATLFAEVVFDRPLDHAYTYAVPDDLREPVAVGKRVLAPFGKGDKADRRLLRRSQRDSRPAGRSRKCGPRRSTTSRC